ncbi:MAG TPA: helix-turn-helix transcriptional regulator [Actinomycetota bacterium]|nr:helix-turn-helix transcriptional regulator [Actinomycetota bacterium]
MTAGAFLREARRSARLSQRELARRAGVAQPVLSRIERGHSSPRFDTLDRLLRQCGKGLELVERPGLGVDRSLIRDRVRLTPGQRARLAAREWERTRAFDRRDRPTT